MRTKSKSRRTFRTIVALGVTATFVLAACGDSDSDSESSSPAAAPGDTAAPGGSAAPSGEKIAVSLITKDSTNAFFVAMQAGAKSAGEAAGVDLTIASGKEEGDEQGQIDAIENAIASGQARES